MATASEIYVRQGERLFMIKVRHSGFDLFDYMNKQGIDWNGGAIRFLQRYLVWRQLTKGGQHELKETINRLIAASGNYEEDYFDEDSPNYTEMAEYMSDMIKENMVVDLDGYLNAYHDYLFFIDFDTQIAYEDKDVIHSGSIHIGEPE